MTPAANLGSSAVLAAASCYTANCLLGAAVALRLVDTSRFRWVHHALFVATATTTAVAVLLAVRARSTVGPALAPALLPLAVIPYAGTRSWRHPALAASAAPAYLAALALSVRS